MISQPPASQTEEIVSGRRLKTQTSIPSAGTVLSSLLRADLTTQWRNRKSFVLILIVPVLILISWKGFIDKFGTAFVMGNCITIGVDSPIRTVLFYRPPHRPNACVSVIGTATVR